MRVFKIIQSINSELQRFFLKQFEAIYLIILYLMLGLEQMRKTLSIMNIDLEPNLVDPQLRAALQWLAASETEVSDLHFRDAAAGEFVSVSTWL